jgi:hypothetical protein
MKKTIYVKFDEEKLFALRTYTEQKGISLEEELAQAAEALFQKLVPGSVKAFLDVKNEATKPKKKSSSSAVGHTDRA